MLNTIRHLDVFSPDTHNNISIDVIGAGATGSKIALSLAKLGLEKIRVWDFDHIESHNVPNQVYGNNNIGDLKTTALKQFIKEQTGTTIEALAEKYEGQKPLYDVVFLLVDSMSERKKIFESSLKFKMKTSILIETRMGKDSGRIYIFNPNFPTHIKKWEETLCEDSDAEVSSCGTSISVGPTADMINGIAVWQLMKQLNFKTKGGLQAENEIIFSVTPNLMILSRYF